MAEAVLSSHSAVEFGGQESSGGTVSIEHETGVPLGYSSGYGTSSEARTPKVQPKNKRTPGSSNRSGGLPSSRVSTFYPSSVFTSPSHVHFQQHPLTGQIEPARMRRRGGPFQYALERISLDTATRQQLINANEFLLKGKYAEAIPCLEVVLTGAKDLPDLQSQVWMHLGNAHVAVGNNHKASVCYYHHLTFCREKKDFSGMTTAECNLGIAYMKLGLLKLAGRCFLQYLENSQHLRDNVSVARAYSNLGMLSKTLAIHGYQLEVREGDKARAQEVLKGHLRRAITYFEHHLEIIEHLGDLDKQARVYGNLGLCYEMLHQFPQAIFCHNKRLEISRTTGNRESESCALCNLGNCFRATGKLQESMEYYLLNLELFRAVGNVTGESVCLLNLGTTCELLNRLDKAIEWHTLYLSVMVQKGDLKGQARAFSTLAGLYEETRQLTKAHEYYKKVVGVFHQMGRRDAYYAAALYVQEIKAMMTRQKLLQEKHSEKRKKKKKGKGAMQTISRVTGMELAPKKRSKASINKAGTWTSSQNQPWYQTESASSMSLTSSLIIENPTVEEFPSLATQPDRLYQNQGMSQRLFEQETSMPENHPERKHHFYVLGNIMTEDTRASPEPQDDYPQLDEDEGSITDYESVVEEPHPHSHVQGNERHREELRKTSVVFTGPVEELGLEGTDKEWERWLKLQETLDDDVLSHVGSLNIDMSVFDRPTPLRHVPSSSAPELDQLDD